MKLFSGKSQDFNKILKKYFLVKNESTSLEPLYEVFNAVKSEDFEVVLEYLKQSEAIAENFSYYLHNLFEGKPFNVSLTEANILSENSFFPEFKKRVLNTLLPPVENEDSVFYMVDHLLRNPKKDLKFLQEISEENISELFILLKIDKIILKESVQKELIFSINILAWRMIGDALKSEVLKMTPEYKNYDNPFIALQHELEILSTEIRNIKDFRFTSKNTDVKQVFIYVSQCLEFVDNAFKNSSKYGISNKTNQTLLRIKQQINRLKDIISLLLINKDEDVLNNSKTLVYNILEYKSRKNNIAELFDDSTLLISHLITNHTAETGTKYISSNYKEYFKMLYKASGGGMIVGFLCVLKMLYSYSSSSDFAHAFLYSMNYAMGFVMIYLMHFTLATKQPAMTAATMVKVLSEEQNTTKNYTEFSHLFAKLIRTQFIAFMGNVLWAFPVALAIIYGFDVLLQENLAAQKSPKLLKDLNFLDSKAFLHASIAGVFLFISGIIAGSVGNNSVFYQMPKRLEKNLFLKKIFGEKFSKSIAKFYENNWPGIISNVWFGVFLGVAGPIGHFLGIDLDIRHITFAAGNFALGLYGNHFEVSTFTIWISIATIFGVGFFNFIVSFGLSMTLALRSRKIDLQEFKQIRKAIFSYFVSNPWKFFLPIRSQVLDSRSDEMMVKSIPKKSEDR
ncbi:recombinase [Frigoriflavimonas asaccharolytica]|uniref:Site-specific recombinase n=1 Tax=Frigoriflavimonas asaccharolytica TaxID=2735899 RepID=A0A8J8G561_9FLAO|nr:recombinase [Frigoriflavimonas asaccharolytica]NRS91266.1 site-specific recombinase [Frigoriflavimonas asaccharolytica]